MRLTVGAAFLGALLIASAVAEDKFDLAPPPVLSNDVRMNLWSTYYYVLSADAVPPNQGFKLLGRNGQDLGVSLRKRAWCDAAIEGTVTVNDSPRPPRTFNFFGVWQRQVDCLQYYPSYPQISRTIYAGVPADAPFGLGDTPTFRLVPFRSIAVDRSVPAFRLKAGNQIRKVALFIPGLRGIPIKTPDGRSVLHDGYVFAADTGGGIKGNHIDFFSGTDPNNPAPNLILSTARPTFPAYLVQDASIREFLYKLHTRD